MKHPETFLSYNRTNKTEHYPCMCEALKPILIWARITGILPGKTLKKDYKITKGCRLTVSKTWFIYSITLIIFYTLYGCGVYGTRWFCMVNQPETHSWYVVTIGYFMTDFDSVITITTGVVFRKEILQLFERLSKLNGAIDEGKTLRKHAKILLVVVLAYFVVIFASHVYTFVDNRQLSVFGCSSLDASFAVIIRGATTIFQMVQLMIVYVLCFLIWRKFEFLAGAIRVTVGRLQGGNITINPVNHFSRLEHFAFYYHELLRCLDQLNHSMGLQILVAISSSLYSTIYYLYKYCTSTEITTNPYIELHYILGIIGRLLKLLAYMILGQKIYVKSKLPLQSLQRAEVLNLPQQIQLQLQTLMLQWSGTEGNLSAFGVVRLGPWLLAPIIGNVITYLLVALQFEKR